MDFDHHRLIVLKGANGIGKSLLVNYLLLNSSQLCRSKCSFLLQDRINSLWDYTVEQVVQIFKNADKDFLVNKLLARYESLSILNLYDLKLNSLSGGEMQKLKVFLAVNKESSLFIFDEPFAHLDSKAQLDLASFFEKCDLNVLVIDHTSTLNKIGLHKELVIENGVMHEL